VSTTQTRLGPADHGRALSPDAFRDSDVEPGYLYELARGRLEVTRVPNDSHWQVVDNLREMIGDFRRTRPGLILRAGGGGECQVWVPELASGRNPDLAVVLAGTPVDSRGRRPPSLVAEVVSAGAEARERDYVAKREEYLAAGVREYWVVDPERLEVTLLSLGDRAGWSEAVFRGGDRITSALLPGFAGTVAGLWADAGIGEEG